MKFSNTVTLLGVVGKKGNGTLDDGTAWATDRVELHCLTEFDSADSMAHGNTVQVHQIQDYNAHYDKAKACIGQKVVIDFELVASKKLGQAPKMVARSFSAEKVAAAK